MLSQARDHGLEVEVGLVTALGARPQVVCVLTQAVPDCIVNQFGHTAIHLRGAHSQGIVNAWLEVHSRSLQIRHSTSIPSMPGGCRLRFAWGRVRYRKSASE